MQTGIYRNLLDRAGFPAIGVREDGVVYYKNPAAEKYLPMLRRGADVIRRLRGREPLSAGAVVEIAGDSPYRRAAVFSDENRFTLLFLSRLQYPDAEKTAKRLISTCGTELSAVLSAKEDGGEDTSAALPFGKERIYTDLIGITEQDTFDDAYVYDIQEIIGKLSKRLKGAFRSLGYRISIQSTASAWDKKYVKINLYDFIFAFSRFLYIQMRCSENGTIGIECGRDESCGCHLFRFTARTSLSPASVKKSGDIVAFLSRLAPECALELSLFHHAGELSRNTRLSVDKYGKFIVEYRLKYIEKPVLHIRSVDFEDLELDAAIDTFLHEIRTALKG